MYTCKKDAYFLWARAVSHTSASFASELNMYLQLNHIHFISPAYIERSNVLTHLVAPYRGQATRDVRVLNMYSVCKSKAEARPLAAVWGPHIQFLILTLVRQRGVPPTSLLLPPCPPPPPSGPPRTPGATKMLIGFLIYCFICYYL